jgi:hypothetical protein
MNLSFPKAGSSNRQRSIDPYRRAPTFRRDSIAPNAAKLADSLTSTYNPKSAICQERQAREVFRVSGCL